MLPMVSTVHSLKEKQMFNAIELQTPALKLRQGVRRFANGLFRRFTRVDCIGKAAILRSRVMEVRATNDASARSLIATLPY